MLYVVGLLILAELGRLIWQRHELSGLRQRNQQLRGTGLVSLFLHRDVLSSLWLSRRHRWDLDLGKVADSEGWRTHAEMPPDLLKIVFVKRGAGTVTSTSACIEVSLPDVRLFIGEVKELSPNRRGGATQSVICVAVHASSLHPCDPIRAWRALPESTVSPLLEGIDIEVFDDMVLISQPGSLLPRMVSTYVEVAFAAIELSRSAPLGPVHRGPAQFS